MNLIFEVEGSQGAEVTKDQIQFTWEDMVDFANWCANGYDYDGLTLAAFLSDKHKIEII